MIIALHLYTCMFSFGRIDYGYDWDESRSRDSYNDDDDFIPFIGYWTTPRQKKSSKSSANTLYSILYIY